MKALKLIAAIVWSVILTVVIMTFALLPLLALWYSAADFLYGK